MEGARCGEWAAAGPCGDPRPHASSDQPRGAACAPGVSARHATRRRSLPRARARGAGAFGCAARGEPQAAGRRAPSAATSAPRKSPRPPPLRAQSPGPDLSDRLSSAPRRSLSRPSRSAPARASCSRQPLDHPAAASQAGRCTLSRSVGVASIHLRPKGQPVAPHIEVGAPAPASRASRRPAWACFAGPARQAMRSGAHDAVARRGSGDQDPAARAAGALWPAARIAGVGPSAGRRRPPPARPRRASRFAPPKAPPPPSSPHPCCRPRRRPPPSECASSALGATSRRPRRPPTPRRSPSPARGAPGTSGSDNTTPARWAAADPPAAVFS
jgi:hypothetical protein